LDQLQSPFFRPHEGGVDEALLQVQATARQQIVGQRPEHSFQPTIARPLLEAPMAGLVRPVSLRQVLPGRSGPQNPEHPIQELSGIAKRPPSVVRPAPFPQERRYVPPLFVGQVAHARSSCQVTRNVNP
jgi:hypothetical protein